MYVAGSVLPIMQQAYHHDAATKKEEKDIWKKSLPPFVDPALNPPEPDAPTYDDYEEFLAVYITQMLHTFMHVF